MMASFFAAARRTDASPKPVLRRLLPPLTAIVILLMVGAGMLLWQQQRKRLAEDISHRIFKVSDDLRIVLDEQAAGLAMALQPIAADPGVQTALLHRDTDRLMAAWRPAFEKLRRENHVTHLYFLDKNRVCLLRVHQPDSRGDLINRFTALEAKRTGKAATGIELGPLGTFTLRAVQPVFVDGALVGYVELGKEIEEVLQALHTRSGIQLAVVICKEFLNRQSWEDGMRTLGREADWDRVPRSVVIYASRGHLPDALVLWADHSAGGHVHGETDREIAFDGKVWRVSAMPLQDASGKEVGDLLIERDVSTEKAAFARLLTMAETVSGALLALLLAVVYVLLRRTDVSILAQQAELRESEARHRLLFDHSVSAIAVHAIVLDAAGRPMDYVFLSANPAFETHTGLRVADILGRRVTEILPGVEKSPLIEIFGKVVLTGEAVSFEQYSEPLGRHFFINAYRLGEGRFATVFTDITERKRAEEQLRQSAEELARSNDDLQQFAYVVSHDLQEPLRTIIGFLGLLEQKIGDQVDAEAKQYVQYVVDGGKRMQQMIADLLAYARVGAKDAKRQRVALREPLDRAVEMLRASIDESAATINVGDLPTIQADASQWSQVFQNLIGNAFKFRSDKPLEIHVGAKPDGSFWLVWVKDNGIGLDPEYRDRVFEVFQRLHTHKKFPGSGIGLAICKKVVERHGGRIWVESQPQQGATFYFTIPAATDEPPLA